MNAQQETDSLAGKSYKSREMLLEENTKLRARVASAEKALKLMQKACDEWAASKRRGMDWGIVNTAYVETENWLRGAEKS